MLLTWHCTSSSSTWTSSNLCLVTFVDFNSYQTLRSLATDLPKAVYTLPCFSPYIPTAAPPVTSLSNSWSSQMTPPSSSSSQGYVWGGIDNLMTNSETTARSSVLLNQWGWLGTSGGSHAQHKPAWLPGGYCRSWEMKTSKLRQNISSLITKPQPRTHLLQQLRKPKLWSQCWDTPTPPPLSHILWQEAVVHQDQYCMVQFLSICFRTLYHFIINVNTPIIGPLKNLHNGLHCMP